MAVLEDLTDEEAYLYTILTDPSGLDQAEFMWSDPEEQDGVWRAWDYQWKWFRNTHQRQIDQCIAAGQHVLTDRGYLPIEDVVVGDKVLTDKGRFKSVTYVWDRGEAEVVSVAGQGHFGLVVTPDHKILSRKARRASQPKDGHKGKKLLDQEWLSPMEWEWSDGSGTLVANWASPKDIEPLPVADQMAPAYASGRQNYVEDFYNSEWMWLYGLYLAEGSTFISKKDLTRRVCWSIHEKELETVAAVFEKLKINYSVQSQGLVRIISVNSRPICEWLIENGGRLAPGKRLASWVYGLPRNLREAIFDGAVYGDGSIRPNGNIQYSTVSRSLAWGMKTLASSLGYAVSVSLRIGGSAIIQGRKVNTRDAFSLQFSGAIGVGHRSVDVGDGLIWSPVRRVQPAGIAHVYDLEVEDDHSFVVEGVVVSNCSRSAGKSLSIKLRAFAFPFLHPGQFMMITAPELTHLKPIITLVEEQILNTRLTREMLPRTANKGITHKLFNVNFLNGAKLEGRIPQRDGRGVKGAHPLWLELDEGQDYPDAGWVEILETLKRGHEGAVWRVHGVTKGVRDYFYKFTQPKSGFSVHRYTAMHRPTWTDMERSQKIEEYGSRENPDYRRNVLGLHGDATNPLFVLHRLMECVDDDLTSDYNTKEYTQFRINAEMLEDMGGDIVTMLNFPANHKGPEYVAYWAGQDVGYTNHPSEVLVFGELRSKGESKLKLLTRINLTRISHGDQVRAILHIANWYNVKAYSMDKTGLGLPLFQDIQEKWPGVANVIKGYNFSGKILVDFDKTTEIDEYKGDLVKDAGIERNVLEYASDRLRDMVDRQQLILPWDTDLIGEMQGQTYVVVRDTLSLYGKKSYSRGKFHALDAMRMAVLGKVQTPIEEFLKEDPREAVIPVFVSF